MHKPLKLTTTVVIDGRILMADHPHNDFKSQHQALLTGKLIILNTATPTYGVTTIQY